MTNSRCLSLLGQAFPLFCLATAVAGVHAQADQTPRVGGRSDYEAAKRHIDPRRDGWESEALSEASQAKLKHLAGLLEEPAKLSAENLLDIAGEDFSCGPLRPEKFEIAYRDKDMLVRRGKGFGPDQSGERGPARLAAALGELIGPMVNGRIIRSEFKQFRVNISGRTMLTQVYFHAAGFADERLVQQNGLVECDWIVRSADEPPKLASLRMSDYEEVVTRRGAGPLLADCTQAVLGQNECFREQLLYGQEHWLRRRQLTLGLDHFGHHGLAIGDVNGDGLEDVYVCQTGGLPNRLFVQNRDGTATDRAAELGVDVMERTHAALFVDLNNDGHQDLVLAAETGILVFANDGTGKFTLKSVGTLPGAFSLAAADFNDDGLLDIYACFYAEISQYDRNAGLGLTPLPYHDANNGAPNALLRNDGDWKFTDVTGDVGLDQNNRRWSFAASWEDFDNDGDLDLYVANDFGRNNLYRNDGGRFTDVAAEAGVEDIASGMSVSWGDYNRDGNLDLYIGNMFSAAGNRIAFQRRFHADSDALTKEHLQRLARGNTLFLNTGDGKFLDVSERAGVTMGRWAWSCNWVDLNNNGWLDLVVANGYITNRQPDDL